MTQKPLIELVPDILDHFRKYQFALDFNQRIYEILEGQIRKEVELSLSREMLDKSALRRTIERIPPVNVLRKAADKLSRVYVSPPVRKAASTSDQSILDSIITKSGVDAQLAVANFIYNGMKSFAIEPYVDLYGCHRFRVLAPHQFLPFSDDPTDPTNMTVLIKMLGTERKQITKFDAAGFKLPDERPSTVTIMGLYSADEFLIIDSSGAVRMDKMAEMGVQAPVNPFGRIPFVYRSKSKLELVPFPNQEGFDISVLIPKLLADLNYAAQFMSHSIIWARNADLQNQSINPDTVVDLGDGESGGVQPEMGVITPSVDINAVLEMIQFELNTYFTSIGIRAEKSSGMTNGRDVSGVAKAIDEADVTSEQKAQTEMFRSVERDLWTLVDRMQVEWASAGIVTENRVFSSNFVNNFQILFGEVKVNKSTRQLLEEVKMLRDMKLVSKADALRMIYPELSPEEIDRMIERAMADTEMSTPPQLQQSNGGQFSNGNEAAAQQEADNLEDTPE